jgi:sodium transport system ATP-binding protein
MTEYMSAPILKAINLEKTFQDKKKGKVEAVRDVSFEAYGGEIFGLLGPNGAGKTTAMRMLATILTPSGGTAEVNGFDIIQNPDGVRKSLGFLSGDTGLYARLSAKEMIIYFGKLYGMKQEQIDQRLQTLIIELELGSFIDRRCGKLSTGQKQKVSIARTVIHDPPVLILDEPSSGLDVLASRNIIRFINTARERGNCIILSSHDMGEVERLCDRIAIIFNGEIITIGAKQDLYDNYQADNMEEVFLKAIGVEA